MEENGEFCGDVKACSEVDAIGARAMLEAKKAEIKARQNKYAWDLGANGASAPSDYIDSVLANNAK